MGSCGKEQVSWTVEGWFVDELVDKLVSSGPFKIHSHVPVQVSLYSLWVMLGRWAVTYLCCRIPEVNLLP